MNAFDYFFENTSSLEKLFLVGKEEISYKQLYSSSLSLAEWIENKVGRNKHILLLSVNNLYFIKSYLAILKSGNICVPLDPSIEAENYKYISDLIRPEIIFITHEVEKRLNLKSDKSVFPDTIILPETPDKKHETRNAESFDSERCAEIIFTSGSTGKPKGVMISHKNLIANTGSIVEYLRLTFNDRMLVVLPFYYCYGLSLLHTHLRAGGSIVLNNSFMFLGTVINNLSDFKCTGFAGVPSHFQILLRMSDTFKETKFPDLKYVTQAGGKLATVFIDEFTEAFPEIKFFVMYGQTEATARLSYLPPELYKKKKGSIGKGIPGVQLKVVDKNGVKIIPGETGEIVAQGDNIMIGYFADDESTENSIREGWLFTGDLGTVDEDDFIYLTARKREIIKVGGKRISPKEIESVILALPEVVDCTIEGFNDDILGEAIKATVIINPAKSKNISIDLIKKHCLNHLSQYKIPQLFELRDSLIISSSGKKIKGKT